MNNISLASYLYGETSISKINEMWDSRRRIYLPVQSSPLKEYVNDVNRFLFSGGINVSLPNLPDEHYSHQLIKTVSDKYIQSNLFSIWELLALTGELLIVVRQQKENFSLEFFDKREYRVTTSKGNITEVKVKTIVELEGKRYIYRFEINSFNYKEYPLVLEEKETHYDWESSATYVNHNYGVVPVQIIGLNKKLTNNRGQSEFNQSSLMLAKSIASIEYGLDENLYFFGNPLIDSPDPKRTIKDLNNKVQVLQKLPNEEGGSHELLQPVTLSSSELEYLKFKKESFKRAMGVTNTQETRFNDASGIALMIMNDGLISKAQSKWTEIVTYGIEPLFQLILSLAEKTQVIGLGSKKDAKIVEIHRSQPYFIQTNQEKLQSLEIAQRLIEMGVDRARALQETYYTNKTLQDIEEMLRPNLEDL